MEIQILKYRIQGASFYHFESGQSTGGMDNQSQYNKKKTQGEALEILEIANTVNIKNGQLSRYLTGGSTQEIIVKGTQYAFGFGDVTDIVVTNEGSIYMAIDNSLYYYVYDKTATNNNKEIISIFSLKNSNVVQNAIRKWRIQFPEIAIEFTIGMDGSHRLSKDDVIKQLNTKLLSGEGPDIIILDGLATESMIEKGFLQDMNGKIMIEKLLKNSYQGYKKEEKIYAIATNMKAVLLGGKQKVEVIYDSFSDFVEKLELQQGGEPIRETSILGNDGIKDAGDVKAGVFLYANNSNIIFDGVYPSFSDGIWKDNRLNEKIYINFLTETQKIISHLELKTINQKSKDEELYYNQVNE